MTKVQLILSQLPPFLHKRAQFVLDAMLTSKHAVDWDNELMLIANNRPILGSNVANLVSHVLYPTHPSIKEPIGFDIFVKMLKKIGLEHEYVNNKKARKALRENTKNYNTIIYDDDEEEEEEEEDEDDDDDDVEDDDDDDDDGDDDEEDEEEDEDEDDADDEDDDDDDEDTDEDN